MAHVIMVVISIFGSIVFVIVIISFLLTCCRAMRMRRACHAAPRVTPVVVSLPPRTVYAHNPPAYPGYVENCAMPPPYSVVVQPSAPPPYGFSSGVNPSAPEEKRNYHY